MISVVISDASFVTRLLFVLDVLQRKPQGTILAPVIDLKGRKSDVPSELRFNQQTGKVLLVLLLL